MATLRLLLGDQLTRALLPAAGALRRDGDVVLMAEVMEEATYVPHHPQKLVLVFSAMRHFAAALRAEGVTVDYVALDDAANSGSLEGEVRRALARHACDRVSLVEAGEWRLDQAMRGWSARLGVPVERLADPRFFVGREEFAAWAGPRRRLQMEPFYRELRRRTGLLMDGATPAGGRWNFDRDNRAALPADVPVPPRLRFPPDPTTRNVIDLVRRRFGHHFGDVEPFGWPVTRAEALQALDHFVAQALPLFGRYQDAMREGAPFLFHSLIAPALNLGLLQPQEVCARAEDAWRSGTAPLAAVEGFVRQILGWREYVRGVYWLHMPGYAESNALQARRRLPSFYWSGDTPMNCLRQVIDSTRRQAYSHHIQRLMVTGNFGLLAGIAPAELSRWYLAVYADAFQWVETPNTLGMALHADGGLMSSKPYAASGAYINRMSNFCKGCAFNVRRRSGPGACPFNSLYWAFLIRHQGLLGRNPRMAMPYRQLQRWSEPERRAIVAAADALLDTLN